MVRDLIEILNQRPENTSSPRADPVAQFPAPMKAQNGHADCAAVGRIIIE
jgi:hypothetical protein